MQNKAAVKRWSASSSRENNGQMSNGKREEKRRENVVGIKIVKILNSKLELRVFRCICLRKGKRRGRRGERREERK